MNQDASGKQVEQDSTPPYWLRDLRSVSEASCSSERGKPPPILLEDHTFDGSEQNNALWARHATVDDYAIIRGNAHMHGGGAYVVWNCTVDTLDGGKIKIRRRYSEFDDLRQNLVKTFPHCDAAIPELPPKSLISRFRPSFLEKRREGLGYFLNCILLNPEYCGSPVLKDFLFT